MTYTEQNDQVRLEMTKEEFNKVIFFLGVASGVASRAGDHKLFIEFMALANDVNAGNPNWTPYAIPDEGRESLSATKTRKQ